MPANIALWHERALLIFVFKTFQALDTFFFSSTDVPLSCFLLPHPLLHGNMTWIATCSMLQQQEQ